MYKCSALERYYKWVEAQSDFDLFPVETLIPTRLIWTLLQKDWIKIYNEGMFEVTANIFPKESYTFLAQCKRDSKWSLGIKSVYLYAATCIYSKTRYATSIIYL